ncbi:MAG: NAD(+) synthase [Wenzhouxiangellaceae bacterium]|nr:NAD(+) synthase [Wenzhouxiangellaceae bacterium]
MTDKHVDLSDFGFVRAAAVAPVLALADPATNADRIAGHLRQLAGQSVGIALFPELCLTGYSCEDLFFNTGLQRAVRAALVTVAEATDNIVAVVGAPWWAPDGRLFNAAIVVADGQIRGVVPKQVQPNYGEFYERRWFASGTDVDQLVDDPEFGRFHIGCKQLFQAGSIHFGVEICEDLWAPRPPGIDHCLAGAELVLNPSASPEHIAKADFRRSLVHMASARGISGYLYAGSGPMESTRDVVYGGHLLAFENGKALGESDRFSFDAQTLITEFDVEKLHHDRVQTATFAQSPRPGDYRRVRVLGETPGLATLTRAIEMHPFIPDDKAGFEARAREIMQIQATGLARRVLASGSETLVLGLSGGLDSTLAFLVCLEALDKLGRAPDKLHALTLPGPATSEHTLTSARQLAKAGNVKLKEISINAAVRQHLQDLEHERRDDVVFENAQARERTQVLFNTGNQVQGIVVGTGSLSELALGWCTYNADHMAGYNVNAGVPKTLVRYLVRWYAANRAEKALSEVLNRVLETPVSPELLPAEEGRIAQHTEQIIGPYELHDFFLFHFMRNGARPAKIYHLACIAFDGSYPPAEIHRWLLTFVRRFFTQQFKRSTLPAGPKVGTITLSPRGDWRMPDEAVSEGILAELEAIDPG